MSSVVLEHKKEDCLIGLLTPEEMSSMNGDKNHDSEIIGAAILKKFAEYKVTKESVYAYFMWCAHLALIGGTPGNVSVRLKTEDGRRLDFGIRISKEMKLYDVHGISTANSYKFYSGAHDLNMCWGKAKPEHGDFFYNVRFYQCGTVGGVYSFDKNTFYLISIGNLVKHNGDFEQMIDALESQLHNKGFSHFTVLDFENDNLKEYFLKRGYKPVNKYDIDGVQMELV